VRAQQPGDEAKEGGFPGPVGTYDSEGFTGLQQQVQPLKDASSPERALEAASF
jgi:hypothetical protein